MEIKPQIKIFYQYSIDNTLKKWDNVKWRNFNNNCSEKGGFFYRLHQEVYKKTAYSLYGIII